MTVKPFFDAHIRGPRGGWTFPIGGGQPVTRFSEGDLLEEMERWERNQPNPRSRAELKEVLWSYFCEREPERCGGPDPRQQGAPADFGPPVVTKEMQGPPIWNFLATLAVQWTPGLHPYFLDTLNAIIVILECENCRNEWRRMLRDFPARELRTKFEVCQWVNTVHNQVNSRISKGQFPYREMVRQFGAPVS